MIVPSKKPVMILTICRFVEFFNSPDSKGTTAGILEVDVVTHPVHVVVAGSGGESTTHTHFEFIF